MYSTDVKKRYEALYKMAYEKLAPKFRGVLKGKAQ